MEYDSGETLEIAEIGTILGDIQIEDHIEFLCLIANYFSVCFGKDIVIC